MTLRLDFPDFEDPTALADWIEAVAIITDRVEMSKAELLETFAGSVGLSAQELETPISMAFSEIKRRKRIVGDGYPIETDGNILRLDTNADHEFYKFLLLVSMDGPMRKGRRFKEVDEIFDKVVSAAMVAYLGHGAQAVRFGWPVSDGRPKPFVQAVEWLCTTIGMPVGSGRSSASTKDGGVDVVAWKPFADQRSAFVVALAQCTIQSDWYPKRKDVIERLWFSRIDTGGWAVTVLAVPFSIPKNFENWDDLRRAVNVVMDRLRIVQMLAPVDSSGFALMRQWSAKEIARMLAA